MDPVDALCQVTIFDRDPALYRADDPATLPQLVRCTNDWDRGAFWEHDPRPEVRVLLPRHGQCPAIARVCTKHAGMMQPGWHLTPVIQRPAGACRACGWEDHEPPTTSDNAHDSLCCGSPECGWWGKENETCATHDWGGKRW